MHFHSRYLRTACLAKALGVDYTEAAGKLKANGIAIEGAATIGAIWITNHTSPEEAIDLIME